MIAFPDWYEGGYPDRELVMCDLTQRWLDELTPQGLSVTWLPDNLEEVLAEGRAVVHVYRGGLGAEGIIDAAAVQLGVITATRADSWAVLEYLRQMLLTYKHGGPVRREDGSTTQISYVEEMIGPQQLADYNPDNRLVRGTWRVECRLPRDIPDYVAIRESLPL
ncbi:phage tail termination protein [Nocardia xishanensis]